MIHRRRFYPSDELLWKKRIEKLEKSLERIALARASRQFCDKWGHPLEVGDSTNEGTITKIEGEYAIFEDKRKIDWTHLVKVEPVELVP